MQMLVYSLKVNSFRIYQVSNVYLFLNETNRYVFLSFKEYQDNWIQN